MLIVKKVSSRFCVFLPVFIGRPAFGSYIWGYQQHSERYVSIRSEHCADEFYRNIKIARIAVVIAPEIRSKKPVCHSCPIYAFYGQFKNRIWKMEQRREEIPACYILSAFFLIHRLLARSHKGRSTDVRKLHRNNGKKVGVISYVYRSNTQHFLGTGPVYAYFLVRNFREVVGKHIDTPIFIQIGSAH